MCGITGFIGKIESDAPVILKKMTDAIIHRGPDDEGFFTDDHAALGFRRLSIIDLSTGHQPMSNTRETLRIVFNGEIYNYREIKAELQSKGYVFRNQSDTEVILNAYEEWGVDCLKHLNGMFAFVIWDSTRRKVFAARDRLGVKPFYYALRNGVFFFASEIKSILAYPGFPAEVNYSAIDSYMSFLWTPDPNTAFRNIFKLEAGHYLTFQSGKIEIKPYWDVGIQINHHLNEKEWIERILNLLGDSVRNRMISDVPLGAFLSGGIDSTCIVALMNRISDQPVRTYTIGFSEKDMKHDVVQSDVEYARYARDFLNIDYREIILEPRVMDIFPKLVWHMDEPVADPAAISTYLICKASRETLTVMLSGVGGDEIFGGYPRYTAMKIAQQYASFPEIFRKPFETMFIRPLPASRHAHFRNLKKFAKSAALPFRERYLGYRTYFTENEKDQLYSGNFRELLGKDHQSPFAEHLAFFDNVQSQDFLSQIMYVDLKTFLPCLNLQYTDKMSMAASVEVREPLLDYRLVELMACVPPELKLNRLTRKYLFKKAMIGIVPEKIIWRKKAGFGAPIRSWIVNDLKPMIDDVLSESSIKQRGLFEYSSIQKLLKDETSGKEYNSNHIWQLLTLEMWFRTFIDGK